MTEFDGQSHIVMLLSSRVTAPPSANRRPFTEADVVTVILVTAIITPWKMVPVPRVALEPILQNTLHGDAPFIRSTIAPVAVVSVDTIWKMNIALASPPASSVRIPVNCADEEK